MTKQVTWSRHPDYAGGQWIKLFKGRDISRTKERTAQGFALCLKLWLKTLRNDKKYIFKASAQAQKAIDYLNQLVGI